MCSYLKLNSIKQDKWHAILCGNIRLVNWWMSSNGWIFYPLPVANEDTDQPHANRILYLHTDLGVLTSWIFAARKQISSKLNQASHLWLYSKVPPQAMSVSMYTSSPSLTPEAAPCRDISILQISCAILTTHYTRPSFKKQFDKGFLLSFEWYLNQFSIIVYGRRDRRAFPMSISQLTVVGQDHPRRNIKLWATQRQQSLENKVRARTASAHTWVRPQSRPRHHFSWA